MHDVHVRALREEGREREREGERKGGREGGGGWMHTCTYLIRAVCGYNHRFLTGHTRKCTNFINFSRKLN